MSGWIDPLGVRTLRQALNADIHRMNRRIIALARAHPQGRSIARCRARVAQLGRVLSAIEALERPGAELLPHKELVQGGDADGRRAACEAMLKPEPAS